MQRYIIFFLLISTAVVMWFLIRRERGKRQQMEKYFKGMEIERERISKELHDNVGSELSAITRFEIQVGKQITDQLEERLLEVREQVRNISHRLAIPSFNPSFYAVLKDYLSQRNNNGVQFKLETNDLKKLNKLPQQYMFEIYRITQEAVTNILNYAQATEASVRFDFLKRSGLKPGLINLKLSITDNGTGFDPEIFSPGIGLKNITERAKTLGGTCRIDSREGGGTRITVSFSAFPRRK